MGIRLALFALLFATACGGLSERQVRDRVMATTGNEVLLERDGDDLWLYFATPASGLRVRAAAASGAAPGEKPVATLKSGDRLKLPGFAATGQRFLTLEGAGPPRRLAERRLQIEGAPNFRDLGGYATREGKRVAWGTVYRSGALAGLTAEGTARLGELGIPLVCDFRSDAEVEAEPSVLPAGTQVLRLPIMDPDVDPAKLRERFENGDVAGLDAAFMQRAYEGMLEGHAARFGDALRYIAHADAPTLVHCTAGKDRTGLLSALLLLVLGVPEETVLGDYALSEVYSWRAIRRASLYLLLQGIEPPTMRPLLGTDPAVLAGALATLRENHGNVERYLTGAAGLEPGDVAALRARLLR